MKTDLQTESFTVFGSSRFVTTEDRVTQYSVCFANLCINLLGLPSATREYHPR